jgi:hypothetical protein
MQDAQTAMVVPNTVCTTGHNKATGVSSNAYCLLIAGPINWLWACTGQESCVLW